MEAIVPDRMEAHFEAAKSAKLLTVQGMDHASCGWLVLRLLADWLRKCDVPDGEKSEVGIVIYSLKHSFEFFANNLVQFGVDLKKHEERGHFRFIGELYKKLMGDRSTTPPAPPTLTLEASLELLCDEAEQLKAEYPRTVLLMDGPELTMSLFDDDSTRIEQWLVLVQGASYQFHNAFVAMMLKYPDMNNREPGSFTASMAAIHGVNTLSAHSDMAMMVRGGDSHNTRYDGTVRVMYRMDYEPPTPDLDVEEEAFVYKIKPDGRSIEIIDTYC